MNPIKAIRTESDFEAAVARIEAIFDADFGTPEGEELMSSLTL